MEEKKGKMSWPNIGNKKIVDFLEKSIISDNVAQTYLFIGPSYLGKYTLALAFAKNLLSLNNNYGFSDDNFLSSHADLHVIRREKGKKNISINQIRDFINILNLSSFDGSYKIGIIKEADRLSEGAKHALLKLLEEPKEKVVIILLLNHEESLPKTILSRSQILYFQFVSKDVIYDYLIDTYRLDRAKAKNIASMSSGRPLRAVEFAENKELYDNYIKRVKSIFSLLNSDNIERLKLIEELSIDSSNSFMELLSILEGLLRDNLLILLNQPEFVQYPLLITELKEINWGDNVEEEILNRLSLVSTLREYVNSNVSYKTCLEQLMLNL